MPSSAKSAAGFAALALAVAVPAAALAQGAGGPGCTNLPLYNRALGALQGMTSACDMSVEEACRVLARQGVQAAACQPPARRLQARPR